VNNSPFEGGRGDVELFSLAQRNQSRDVLRIKLEKKYNIFHVNNSPFEGGGGMSECKYYMNKIIPYEPYLKKLARKLRKNSTLSEILLWKEIRRKSLGIEFHRQVPIDRFIVDFYCHELRLAIEIDGNSHDFDESGKNDIDRQQRLESLGINFIRFDDLEVKKNMAHVILQIQFKMMQMKR
jgi:very-short-patch-repair endonuclease